MLNRLLVIACFSYCHFLPYSAYRVRKASLNTKIRNKKAARDLISSLFGNISTRWRKAETEKVPCCSSLRNHWEKIKYPIVTDEMSLTYSECLHCLFSQVNKLMLSYLKKCFCVYLAASVVTRGRFTLRKLQGASSVSGVNKNARPRLCHLAVWGISEWLPVWLILWLSA
jgi:hypothetical protein